VGVVKRVQALCVARANPAIHLRATQPRQLPLGGVRSAWRTHLRSVVSSEQTTGVVPA
jgi:hypothetical protein